MNSREESHLEETAHQTRRLADAVEDLVEEVTTIDVRVAGDQCLSAVEIGDISILVAAPVGASDEELGYAAQEATRAIARYSAQFADGQEVPADV